MGQERQVFAQFSIFSSNASKCFIFVSVQNQKGPGCTNAAHKATPGVTFYTCHAFYEDTQIVALAPAMGARVTPLVPLAPTYRGKSDSPFPSCSMSKVCINSWKQMNVHEKDNRFLLVNGLSYSSSSLNKPNLHLCRHI